MVEDSLVPNLEKQLIFSDAQLTSHPPQNSGLTLKPRTTTTKRPAADAITPGRESAAKRHEPNKGLEEATVPTLPTAPSSVSTAPTPADVTTDPFLAPPHNRPLPSHLSFNKILLPASMDDDSEAVTPATPTPETKLGSSIALAPTPPNGFAPIQLPPDLLTRFSNISQVNMVLEQKGEKIIALVADDRLSNDGNLRRKVISDVLPVTGVDNPLVMQIPVERGKDIRTGFRVPVPLVITSPDIKKALANRIVAQRCFSSPLGTFFAHPYPIPIPTFVTILKGVCAPNTPEDAERMGENIQKDLTEDTAFIAYINHLRDGHDDTTTLEETASRILKSVTAIPAEPTAPNATTLTQWRVEMLCPSNQVERWKMWVGYLRKRTYITVYGIGTSIGPSACNYCQCLSHTQDYCTYKANETLHQQVPLTAATLNAAEPTDDLYASTSSTATGSGQRGTGRGGAGRGRGMRGKGRGRGRSH